MLQFQFYLMTINLYIRQRAIRTVIHVSCVIDDMRQDVLVAQYKPFQNQAFWNYRFNP